MRALPISRNLPGVILWRPATMILATAALLGFATGARAEDSTRPAEMVTGIKVVEVTNDSAIVWARTTDREGAGKPGRVEVEYWVTNSHDEKQSSGWLSTDPDRDYTKHIALEGLTSGAAYELRVRSSSADGNPGSTWDGSFTTAPAEDQQADITFVVVTGQEYSRRDAGERGHRIYALMLDLQPSFFVHTGDVVYYDKPEPLAKDVATARFKWARMYSQPLQRAFHQRVPSYFMKDNHDILKDDCWPDQTYGSLTWDEGVAIFREQTAQPPVPYRTYRWGQDLQVWLLEGREFRSPNDMPDGPKKTILGAEQLEWLQTSLDASDATFRIVISATPIVGPDRSRKRDNHSNEAFKHEGDWLRRMLAEQENLYVVCGDRHWQYASVDPTTKLREYSCGPTTDQHAGGWSDDQFDPAIHKFLRVKGGFLSVQVHRGRGQPSLVFRHHAVDGKIVNEDSWQAN